MAGKVPSRSPTHLDVELGKLAALGLEAEELAEDGAIALPALVELAEDRGKPVSHYLAALALSDDVALASSDGPRIKVCAGSCQQWGALDLLEHLATRWSQAATFTIVPVSCLDRCDRAAVCVIDGADGALVVEEATIAKLDEALDTLSR
jgi:NADH:ubiquinone oxidoreductase subunit E